MAELDGLLNMIPVGDIAKQLGIDENVAEGRGRSGRSGARRRYGRECPGQEWRRVARRRRDASRAARHETSRT